MFKVVSAFLVESRLFIVLLKSVFNEPDICLLVSNPYLHSTFSGQSESKVDF